jgi:CBS domain-containing protein
VPPDGICLVMVPIVFLINAVTKGSLLQAFLFAVSVAVGLTPERGSPATPVTELAKLMREHDIGAIPIGENDRLIGMLPTETSCVARPVTAACLQG